MANLLELTLNNKLSAGNNSLDFDNYHLGNLQVRTKGQTNDDKEKQIISEAKKIEQVMKQFFPDEKSGFAIGLHVIYNEAVTGKSRLNKLVQEYIKGFKDEKTFRCYFIQHRNASK